jgi:cell division FtsZ-interacting protein ZapD
VRVESCVNTILELNDRLGEGKIKPEIIQQFERLKESLRYVTDDSVDEKDIDRIEEATNQLLAEIKVTYGGQVATIRHEGQIH